MSRELTALVVSVTRLIDLGVEALTIRLDEYKAEQEQAQEKTGEAIRSPRRPGRRV